MKLDIDVNNGVLVDLVRELNEKMDRNTQAVRATNVLLMARALGVQDVTDHKGRSKALRHLSMLESGVASDE